MVTMFHVTENFQFALDAAINSVYLLHNRKISRFIYRLEYVVLIFKLFRTHYSISLFDLFQLSEVQLIGAFEQVYHEKQLAASIWAK